MTDCHCHPLPWFGNEGTESDRIFVNVATPEQWATCLELDRKKYFRFFGIHPWNVRSKGQIEFKQLENLVKNNIPVGNHDSVPFGIGEIGLDKSIPFLGQVDALEFQLLLAQEHNLPVSLHCVKAWGKLFDLLGKYHGLPKIMLHGFTGPKEIRAEALLRGYFISLSARSLDQGQKAEEIPPDKLLLETDAEEKNCPSPASHSQMLQKIYFRASTHLGFTLEKLSGIISDNAAVFTSLTDSRKS